MTTLSACLIVRDEEQNLEVCLRSLRPWVDQICVVDTGSSDGTVSIAEDLADVVGHHEWRADFAEARNASLELATGDWILVIDADEEVDADTGERLREAISTGDRAAWLVTVKSLDDRGGSQSTLIPRLFRNNDQLRYERPIHESIGGSLAALGVTELEDSGVTLVHRGYVGEAVARKRVRNLTILRKRAVEAPDDLFNTFKLAQALKDPEQATEQLSTFEMAHRRTESLSDAEVGSYPFAPLVYEGVARCLWERGNVARAIDVCERGLERFPECVELLYRRAELALSVGDAKLARTNLNAAVAASSGPAPIYASDPWVRSVGPWIGFARADALEGNLESAAGNTARALELDPNDIQARCTSIRIRLAGEDPESGLGELEVLLKEEPGADPVRLLAGEVALAREDEQTAIDIWRAAALRGTTFGVQARCQWAIVELTHGRFDAAHEHLARIPGFDLDSTACRVVIAICTGSRLEIEDVFDHEETLVRVVPMLRQLLESENPLAVEAFANNASSYAEILPGIETLLVPEETAEHAPEPTPSSQ